jgi:hypothetical protein
MRINKGSIHYTCYKGIWKGKKEYYVLDIEFHKNGLVVKEKNWTKEIYESTYLIKKNRGGRGREKASRIRLWLKW